MLVLLTGLVFIGPVGVFLKDQVDGLLDLIFVAVKPIGIGNSRCQTTPHGLSCFYVNQVDND